MADTYYCAACGHECPESDTYLCEGCFKVICFECVEHCSEDMPHCPECFKELPPEEEDGE
jgi:hypothetical protein